MNLIPTPYASSLSRSKVYQIDNALYRFIYSDPDARVCSPRYVFKPIGGQRKTANRVLNENQLRRRLYEVEGLIAGAITIAGNWIQLKLDLDSVTR